MRLIALVRKILPTDYDAYTEDEKNKLCMDIITNWRESQNPKGRFLEHNTQTQMYVEVADNDVKEILREILLHAQAIPPLNQQPETDIESHVCQRKGGSSNVSSSTPVGGAMNESTPMPDRQKKQRKLPLGVYETTAGSWRVRVYYQGKERCIGTFPTLEKAALANEIARGELKKDKRLQLSVEECERNIKLAKEAALASIAAMGSSTQKLPQKKTLEIEPELPEEPVLMEKSSTKSKKVKKKRKRNDPNAPKRGLSAYILYSNANRARVKAENPEAKFGDIVSDCF